MEDVREREAASCIRGYLEDHPSTSDTSRATFFPSTELRNEAARTVYTLITLPCSLACAGNNQ